MPPLEPLRRTVTDLPVEQHTDAIAGAIEAGSLVLTAEPGAGKTSIVPLVAAESVPGRVLVLQPRRLAARAAAGRLADLINDPRGLGGTVGLTMRGERRVGPRTRIEVITEAVLTNRLQRDPELSGVGAVVFDEFHERNLHSDLGLAMALEARAAIRDDLALVVMSATIEVDPLTDLLGHGTDESSPASAIDVAGRTHPIETIHLERPPRSRWADAVADATATTLGDVDGDVLVFVPGRREIDEVSKRLAGRAQAAGVDLVGLHGGTTSRERDRLLATDPARRRQVIVATAVAETSVTLPGVEAVIDGGLARRPRFDPTTGLGRLETFNVTRFSADQRRGRAGRLGPGRCVRLWSIDEHTHLDQTTPPEVTDGDPVPIAFELVRWGDPDAEDLPLLDHPGSDRLEAGRRALRTLGLLDDDEQPTTHPSPGQAKGRLGQRGRRAAGLGLHPRLGSLVLAATEHDPSALPMAARVAATLDDDGHATTIDLAAEVERPEPRVERAAQRITTRLDATDGGDREGKGVELGPLLARAWPDRIAIARPDRPGTFLMANGREAALPESGPAGRSALARAEFLVVAEADGRIPTAGIRRAVALDRREVLTAAADHIDEHDVVEWDARLDEVRAERHRRLGAIVLHRSPLPDPPPERAAAAVSEGLRRRGLATLAWTDRATAIRERLAWLHTQDPDRWPPVDDEALLAEVGDWVNEAGARNLDDVAGIDVAARLLNRLDQIDWRLRGELDRLAPDALSTPTGRQRRVRYDSGRPVWAVRIQDLIGLDVHPSIGPADEPLTIELLTPADRPAQVTADLPGFWRGTYAAVRADLRGRYPKHRWPERPWEPGP